MCSAYACVYTVMQVQVKYSAVKAGPTLLKRTLDQARDRAIALKAKAEAVAKAKAEAEAEVKAKAKAKAEAEAKAKAEAKAEAEADSSRKRLKSAHAQRLSTKHAKKPLLPKN